MLATDTASYSDVVFGLFGIRATGSPHIADVGDTAFWRADVPGQQLRTAQRDSPQQGQPGPDRHTLTSVLRVAGSLITNQVRAYDLLRMLTRDGYPPARADPGRVRPDPEDAAPARDGRPVDETYRRTVTRQLNISESRHSLARKILHGHRGDIMQSHQADQKDQLGALGRQGLPGSGRGCRPTVAVWGTRMSTMLGRYTFPAPSTEQRLRPPRNPDGEAG